jgi:hypothetical protein
LSHGRADNVVSVKTLEKSGYTGQYYIVCDNEDKSLDEYKAIYGDKVLVFDKLKKSKEFDTMDNFNDRRTVVYARNAALDFAKELGLEYYLEFDDDYTQIALKYIRGDKLCSQQIDDADYLFDLMLDFLDASKAKTVALAQGGDFIGGANNGNLQKGLGRKAMNSFFCRTDSNLEFLGRVNEDVNTYTSLGQKGELLFTVYRGVIEQQTTQKNKGGMTEQYLDAGTYVKSFYSIICSPGCVKIAVMNSNHPRIHHKVLWNNCCPKILNEKYKK